MNKILIYYNPKKELAKKIATLTTQYLLSIGINYINNVDINSNELDKIDAIITFGGDGTILSAARKYIDANIPIMGFNVGKLGFLAEFSATHIKQNIDILLNKKYKIIKRFILTAKLNNDNEKYFAVNDFVLKNIDNFKLITLSVFANEQYIGDYRADGLIVASPTGSTAYSLACGGPIISPDTNVYCITPISPHTLTLRPLVIPTTKTIKIQLSNTNKDETASIIADGTYIEKITCDNELEITTYNKEANFIVPLDSNYFDVLRRKLLWAEKVIKS
ncbi:MAG: NAD(+)/NADH kinase [Bacteroidetes bacterium]|nr:NAD(+)/NADH kinase [Bacteroidota bacterium]